MIIFLIAVSLRVRVRVGMKLDPHKGRHNSSMKTLKELEHIMHGRIQDLY